MYSINGSKPSSGDKYFNTRSVGGYSWCIEGQPTISGLNVLCNCVGAACGFFNRQYSEITGYKGMKYPYLNCNAEDFITRARQYYSDIKVVQEPVEGGIMVWEGLGNLAGHVAFVVRCNNSNSVYTAESGWASFAYANYTRTNSNGRWGMSTNYRYLGCLVNPAVGEQRSYTQPAPVPSTKYKVGDVVEINGVYVSSTSTEKLRPAITKGKITRIIEGARNPYLLDDGNIGWVNNDCIVGGQQSVTYKTVANCYWLNLRTSPSYGNNIYKAVQAGTKVEYLGMESGWAKIKYDGRILYCGSGYLN